MARPKTNKASVLDVPASASAGASLKVNARSPISLSLDGTFAADVQFEYSPAKTGDKWFPIGAVLSAPGLRQLEAGKAQRIRANVTAYTSGTPKGYSLHDLSLAPADYEEDFEDNALDVRAAVEAGNPLLLDGKQANICFSGTFDATLQVQISVSDSDADAWHDFGPAMTAPGIVQIPRNLAERVRVNTVAYTSGTPEGESFAGFTDEAVAGDISAASVIAVASGPSRLLWRSGATGDNARSDNVFTNFGDWYAKGRELVPFGDTEMVIDARYSSHLTGGGLTANLMPVGAFDFEDFLIQGPIQKNPDFGQPGTHFGNVDIPEGTTITGLRSVSGPGPVVFNYDGTTDGAILLAGYSSFLQSTAFINSNPAAGAILQAQGFAVMSFEKGDTYGGIGVSVTTISPARCVDLNNGLLVCLLHNAMLAEDTVKGAGTFFALRSNDADGQNIDAAGNLRQPQVALDGGFAQSFLRYASPRRASFANDTFVHAGVSPYQIPRYGDTVPVLTRFGPVIVDLPAIGGDSEVNDQIMRIFDNDGLASASPITVRCAALDTFADGTKSKVIAEDFGSFEFLSASGVWGLASQPNRFGADAAGHTGAAATLANVSGGGGEIGPSTAAAAGWAKMPIAIPGTAPDGTITAVAGSLLTDTDNFVLDDGANPAVTFEFDSDGSVTPGPTLRPVVYNVSATGGMQLFPDRGDGNSAIVGLDFTGIFAGQTVDLSGTPTSDGTYTALEDGGPGGLTFAGVVLAFEVAPAGTAAVADTADNVAIAIADAIAGTPFETLFITLTSVVAAVVTLGGVVGATGNVAITENVADAGFLVTGMANGVDEQTLSRWVQYWN